MASQRRRALLLALLVLAQLLAPAHGKQPPMPAQDGGDGAGPTAPRAGPAAAPRVRSGRQLPKGFSNRARTEAAALAKIAANQSADLIVTFKVSQADNKQQEARIARAASLAGADAAQPAQRLTGEALHRAARKQANEAVKKRALARRTVARGAAIKRDFASLPVSVLTVNSSKALEALRSDPTVASVRTPTVYRILGRELQDDLRSSPLSGGFDDAPGALGVDGSGGGKRKLLLKESLPMIGAIQAAAEGYTGKGCAVAVIDTGVDYTHPDLGSCEPGSVPAELGEEPPAAPCRVSLARDFHRDDYDDEQLDDNGHGTNVASIVAQAAKESQIIALDVFRLFTYYDEEYLLADDRDLLGAIDWLILNKEELNVCAINLSLGSNCINEDDELVGCPSCPDQAMAVAIANAREAGILTAVASGNEALTDGLGSPACAPAAVSVGAVYDFDYAPGLDYGFCKDDTVEAEQVTCFSNSANYLTALAPGIFITAGGFELGGTSQATPHVAATLAVLMAAFPDAPLDDTVEALTTTGKEITDPRNGEKKPLINMLQAATKMASPMGSVLINLGAQWTNSPIVDLYIYAPNATEMCVTSEAATPCTPYKEYAASYTWELPDGDGPKSVFVYFKDSAGVVSDPPANASIMLDATPPSGADLIINGGAEFTSVRNVILAISGTDNYPADLEMCLATCNPDWYDCIDPSTYFEEYGCSPFEPFAPSKNYSLDLYDGPATVWLWLRDAAGNTDSAQADITLKKTTPTGVVTINGGARWTNSPNVTLEIDYNEAVTQICISNDDINPWDCDNLEMWEPPVPSKPWQLPDGDGTKNVFVHFEDEWDWSGPVPASIKLDGTPPSGAGLTINGGDQYTTSPQVSLAISGTDNNQATLQMCLANTDAGSCSPYEPLAPFKNYTLPAGAGPKTVVLWLRDAAGNIAPSAQDQITLLERPSGSVGINGGAAWTTSREVSLSITPGQDVTHVCVADTAVGTAACAPWEEPAASKPWQLPEGDGDKSVFVYFKNAGNDTGGPAKDSITLDSTPPVNVGLTIDGGAEWAASTSVSLAISGSDNNPAGLQMCLSSTKTTADSCTPYEGFAANKTWQLPAGEANHTVYLWLRDAAGNAVGATASIKLDTQAPSGVVVSINDGAAETVGLNVSVAITASDFSGVEKMCIKTAAGAACGEADFVAFASSVPVLLPGPSSVLGPRFVYVTLRDARGNTVSAPASDQITYNDPSVPTSVMVSVVNANSAGWVTTPEVRIAVSGSGAGSVTQICVREDEALCTEYQPFTSASTYTYTLKGTQDGPRTLFVTLRAAGVKSASGNFGARNNGYGLVLPLTFTADLNPPTNTSVSVNGGTGATASPRVLLTVGATDLSGVKGVCITADPEATAASCEPWADYSPSQSFTLPPAEGTSKILAFFRDANGHTSPATATNVTLDISKPKAKKKNLQLKAAPTSNNTVTLTWNKAGATDAVSYVSSFYVLYQQSSTPGKCDKLPQNAQLANAAVGTNGTVTATVKGLMPGKRYGFRVCPVDAAGNVGSGVGIRASTASAGGN